MWSSPCVGRGSAPTTSTGSGDKSSVQVLGGHVTGPGRPGCGCGRLGKQDPMSQTKNMLSGMLAGVRASFATPQGPHTLGKVSSMPSWAPCPPPRDLRRPRSWGGALAGRWARSPWWFSEASSEAAVSPGRKKRASDSLGQDARGQAACLLQRPAPPRLLRKLAEVAFIAAEVRPTHSARLWASPQLQPWPRPHGGGEKGDV